MTNDSKFYPLREKGNLPRSKDKITLNGDMKIKYSVFSLSFLSHLYYLYLFFIFSDVRFSKSCVAKNVYFLFNKTQIEIKDVYSITPIKYSNKFTRREVF